MEINLHNYEAFFLDYKEGNLSAEMQKELFLFLEKHPHLYEELAAFENVTLDDFGIAEVLSDKNVIKKPEFSTEDIISYTEGVATAEVRKEIEVISAQNIDLKKEIALYKSAIAHPDPNIKFKNKDALKKRGVVIALQSNYSFLRVAAAILLLIGLFFIVSNITSREVKNDRVVAHKEELAVPENQNRVKEGHESNESKQLAVNGGAELSKVKNESIIKLNSKHNSSENKIVVKQNIPAENENMAINSAPTNTASTVKSESETPIIVNQNAPKKDLEESPATIRSYYNYRPDNEEIETPVVTASAAPAKRSFFQKIVNVAKNVNKLGVKNVNASEQGNFNSVSIGSLVVTETTSN